MAGLIVKPRARILHGHDWVFAGEVLKTFGHPADGDVISLKDGRDRLIGSAIYNSKSQIVARRFSRRKQALDLDFFQRRIAQAAQYRIRRGVNLQLCRVVWSESDGLPGVIIDRYGDRFVLQTVTLAMDMRKDLICQALGHVFDATNIIERNDSPVRIAEGLSLTNSILSGERPEQDVEFEVAGVRLAADLLRARKTGFYLDQLPNYDAVAGYAANKRVLDCFTNEGAFALACARRGAAEVTGVETSSEGIVVARRNADRNGLQVQWIEDDVFRFLRTEEKREREYDLIILDPPAFAKARKTLSDAIRGYKELHVRAFKLLSHDGVLATFSCSHHVSPSAFASVIREALVDARRSARQLRRFEQPCDHPILPTLPETEYFKGSLLEMMPGR